ncbi:MAG TPA: hypothetical protein GX528_08450 [Firmicutes bacterium]|nr:hypothetical protein [Bacillota bacterium]
MPDNWKKGAQSPEEQLENTRERLDEAQDRLEASSLPEEEQRRIKEKNKHRKEMIAGLESELEKSEKIIGTEKEAKFDPINELGRR